LNLNMILTLSHKALFIGNIFLKRRFKDQYKDFEVRLTIAVRFIQLSHPCFFVSHRFSNWQTGFMMAAQVPPVTYCLDEIAFSPAILKLKFIT
jgi:hypothetical protein